MTRRYPAYRDSGVEWLGEVPETWRVSPLRSQFVELKEKNDGLKNNDYLSLVAGKGVMPYAEKGDVGNKKPDDLEKCKIVKKGQFVINSMNFGIGAFGVSNYDGVCSPVYVVLEPNEPESLKFLRWIFDNREFQETAQSYGNGILAHRSAIGWDDLKVMAIAVPPLPEQTAIAGFLDRETAKIDALVAEQRRLIDLLREKRQAVISHAVTKGLNPNAPLKPSGVDWLGDVPEGWEVNKFSRLVFIAEGQVDPRDSPYASMILIAPNHIESGTGRLSELETAADQGAESGKYMFAKGAVIYSKIRPALAKVVVAPSAGLCSADMYPLTSRGKLQQAYLAWLMLSPGFTAWAVLESDRVAMPKINREKLNELHLPVPPLAEQKAIVEFIETTIRQLDALTATAEAATTLLQERRAALISAAVTGKIDVRNLATAETTDKETAA